MRYFTLIVFGCLLTLGACRPPPVEEDDSEAEETEYEGHEETLDESLTNDEEARLNEEQKFNDKEDVRNSGDTNGNMYLQHNNGDDAEPRSSAANTNNNLPDYKIAREMRQDKSEESTNNIDIETPSKHRQSNRYIENNNDQAETAEHLGNRERSNYLTSRIHNDISRNEQPNKRTIETRTIEDGELLFENNDNTKDQISKIDKKEYGNEAENVNEQPQFFKQYANMQKESRDKADGEKYENLYDFNRNRRQIQKSDDRDILNFSSTPGDKTDVEKSSNEDEETVIKRHIKKLSPQELEELLNSLTEDKRVLLKKIIDNSIDITNDINKREITKKASAVEEISFIESGQSDSNKVQSGNQNSESNTESTLSQNTQTTDANKQIMNENQSEGSEISSTKTAEVLDSCENVENKDEIINNSDAASSEKNNVKKDSKIRDTMESNADVPSKNENKRETNLNDFMDTEMIDNNKETLDLLNNQEYFYQKDDDSSEIVDESESHNANGNTYKREVEIEKEASDTMKSLEVSFPSPNAYDDTDPYSRSDMAPLVRVKRKNLGLIKKRSAALAPDSKVAFVPYRAEDDDRDSDEGNEFDDDGFFDRTSNYAKNAQNFEERNTNSETNDAKISRPLKENMQLTAEGTMSLGTDTDSILSGVEGVDDNLMYNSGSRNRRDDEESGEKTSETRKNNLENRVLRSVPCSFDEELQNVSETIVNVPNYQENDAFGPLPRNYEGDVSRYKRIRRVKQSSQERSDQNSAPKVQFQA